MFTFYRSCGGKRRPEWRLRGSCRAPGPRGHAATEKLVDPVADKDMPGVLTMEHPQERDAVQRVREAAEEQTGDHGIMGDFAKVSAVDSETPTMGPATDNHHKREVS